MNLSNLSFLTPVQDNIKAVEELMRRQADEYHQDLHAALELLISSGGKRIRPALTLLTGQMLGADVDLLVIMAAAIEMLHTATLVHDDLIDSSILRRGSPTLNSQWSPGATVLTGDFIFARAAKLAAETNSVPVIKLFSQTLTIIVNGELTQLFNSRFLLDREEYYRRIYAKTASLFETSTTSAGLISGTDPQTLESVRGYGHEIGMAFQIIDDILDFTGEQATLGKPVGNDLRQGIVTLPAIYYAEKYPEDPYVQVFKTGVSNQNDDCVNHLIEAIRTSDAIQLAQEEACKYIQRGITHLAQMRPCREHIALEELAGYITQREL
jgi:geranylgeranyl pyrophosphate synthase